MKISQNYRLIECLNSKYSNTGMKGRQENKMIKKGKDISDQFKGNGKCEVICEKNKKTLDF